VTALLRNALEAAPPDGWARIALHSAGPQGLEVIVEDSGPGPTAAAQEHLFDPFYSGRSAGRGRGLGLATAWRLAKQNGAEVRFAGHADGVTRFVLHFPLARLRAPDPETNGHHAPLNGTHVGLATRFADNNPLS
jgi:two-component system NtrC family sensor kinase